MATITASSSLSLPIFLSTPNPKPYNLPSLRSSSPPLTSPANLSRQSASSNRNLIGCVILILIFQVIYIGVTDFLQKREKEKFEKEEAAANKNSGKKKKVKARGGPRGFGQKIEEDELD